MKWAVITVHNVNVTTNSLLQHIIHFNLAFSSDEHSHKNNKKLRTLKPKLQKRKFFHFYIKHFIDDSECGITMKDQPFYGHVYKLTAPTYC